jgi:hypothetical protein
MSVAGEFFELSELPGDVTVGNLKPISQYSHNMKRKFGIFTDEHSKLITTQSSQFYLGE